MSNRSRGSFSKRQKEQKRKEKQREKAERRTLRKVQNQAEAISADHSGPAASGPDGEEPFSG